MATLTALYDACVLYPAPLRDLLMHLALTDLFRARWTNAIHEEWMRNVLANRPDLKREHIENPPKTVEEYLATLARLSLPQTVIRLQAFAELI
jgi:hypothetical protein